LGAQTQIFEFASQLNQSSRLIAKFDELEVSGSINAGDIGSETGER